MKDESRTAVLVCAGRAIADGTSSVAQFSDPTAQVLLPDAMRERVAAFRSATSPPSGGRQRMEYQMLAANAGLIVPRTVVIDDVVRRMRPAQLVNLGAGLDGRAWRLSDLAETVVFEVDHPESQAAKRQRSAQLTPTAREIRFVPVDFTTDDLHDRLVTAGQDAKIPTLWIWEGVVPYLTEAEIQDTLRVIGARSAPGSELVIAYVTPSVARFLGRRLAKALAKSGGEDVFEHEPQKSFFRPDRMRELLAGAGFRVQDDRDLVEIAESMAADVAAMGPFARAGRVASALR